MKRTYKIISGDNLAMLEARVNKYLESFSLNDYCELIGAAEMRSYDDFYQAVYAVTNETNEYEA